MQIMPNEEDGNSNNCFLDSSFQQSIEREQEKHSAYLVYLTVCPRTLSI
jgi:hypothetical protein